MTTLVVVLLGFLIVAGTLVSVVWRIRWLRGTLRTRAEVLNVASRDEESGGQYNGKPRFGVGDHVTIRYHRGAPSESAEVPFIVNEMMIWFAMLCARPSAPGSCLPGCRWRAHRR
ncbi:MAG TPA: hypothetical protein VEQ84_19435 [Vicinamibacteria bacterium]|nr:hypothetical protein [Vicinamibacteria bacterium]